MSPLESNVMAAPTRYTVLAATTEADHEAVDQLRQLVSGLEQAREQDRAQFARDLHDELGAALTGLKMDAARLSEQAPALSAADVACRCRELTGLIDEAIDTMRRIAREARPSPVDHLGLVPALTQLVQDFTRRSQVPAPFWPAMEDVPGLDNKTAVALYRILQEALTNVARHASAMRVEVRLYFEADRLVLRVADNGRGISSLALKQGASMGILGMRERMRACGGELYLIGGPGDGTTVLAKVPRPLRVKR